MASIVGRTDASAAAGSVLVRHAPLFAVALASIGILLVYADTVVSMAAIWQRSDTFAHGWLVAPICLWLAWRDRAALAVAPARPWLPALGVVAAFGAVWLVATLADVIALRQFALVFMLQGAIIAVAGLAVARAAAFPLAFLLFAVPFGEFLLPAMIDMTADFTVAALRISGVPVYREGNHFIIPSGAWSVVEACSGLRYLIASMMIGVLYAAISYRSPVRKAAFIAASIVVPLAANWLRAYMIVMLGHLSDNTLAVGVDHLIYGWIFFGVVMGLLFWVGSFWAEDTHPAHGEGARQPATAPQVPAARFYAMAVLAIVVAALWRPLYAGIAPAPIATPVRLAPVAALGTWSATAQLPAPWTPNYTGFSADARQAFVNQGDTAGVYLAYYRDQRKGRELVTTANQLVQSLDRWSEIASGTAPVALDGVTRSAWRATIAGAHLRLVAYRLYWVDGRLAATDAMAKALLAWSRLTGGTGDAALVVVYAVERDGRSGRDVAREALEALWPSIERALVATRESR